jgi:hypothetical protein
MGSHALESNPETSALPQVLMCLGCGQYGHPSTSTFPNFEGRNESEVTSRTLCWCALRRDVNLRCPGKEARRGVQHTDDTGGKASTRQEVTR